MATPTILSLGKALRLLTSVAESGGARNISSIAEELNLPAPTAHRMVATLEQQGFLIRVGRGCYVPGPAVYGLTQVTSLQKVIAAAARPIIETLAKETGLVAHLGMLEDDMVTYLVKAGRASKSLLTREGMQLEAYCSGIGKALLANLPEKERD